MPTFGIECLETEAVDRRCSVKKMFLKILRNLQEKSVPETLFFALAYNFIKKET